VCSRRLCCTTLLPLPLLHTLLLLLLPVSLNDGCHHSLPLLCCWINHYRPSLDSLGFKATFGTRRVLWLEQRVQVGFSEASLAPEPHTCEKEWVPHMPVIAKVNRTERCMKRVPFTLFL
jgi:hypothetical protein